jgi:hypothetical protein
MPKAAPSNAKPAPPERWLTNAGPADVAMLVIPADASRTRHFEIDCRFIVAHKATGARHAMRVDVDGGLEWTRRAPTENPGHTDSMDYHFRREVPVGKPLKIVVKTEARGAQRVGLVIEAEENPR